MKFITVCVIVCAIALNLSFNCANPQGPPVVITSRMNGGHHHFPAIDFKNVLYQQYNALIHRVNTTWTQCNETLYVPGNPQRVDPYVSDTRKCLVDCTLRTLGVISDNGFDEAEYMLHIKELRLNHTSIDINEGSSHLVRNGTCLAIVGASNTDEKFSDLCHVLIESYSLAASECKHLKDPYGDNCETSWMIMSCMIRRHRGKFYESPFHSVFAKKRKAMA